MVAYGGPFIFKFPRKIWDPPKKIGLGGRFYENSKHFYIKSLVGTYVGKSQEKKPGDKNFCKKVPVF